MKKISWDGIAIMCGVLGIILVADIPKLTGLLVWLITTLLVYLFS
jgi:hypothetical protein